VAIEPAFDETIHAPIRLRICGLLRHVEEMDFAVLRDTLAISDASLSKHLKVLLDADYVALTKTRSQSRSDARRLTWIKQTRAGRRAFDAHIEELRRIAAGFPHDAPPREATPPTEIGPQASPTR
jgi:DNA-binding MarR family transcriptional regulator